MKRRRMIVEQLLISADLLDKGTVNDLRLSLILLDNGIEILCHRISKDEIQMQNYLLPTLNKIDDEKLSPDLLKIKSNGLSKTKIKKITRDFNEKIKYLSDKGKLDPSTEQLLEFTHVYRNEAYHNEKIKEDTLKSIVELLFNITCDLFISLNTDGVSWSSDMDNEEWSVFFNCNFNIKNVSFPDYEVWVEVIEKLKERVGFKIDSFKTIFSNHFRERFKEIESNILFIAENSPGEKYPFPDSETKLKQWVNNLSEILKCDDQIRLFNSLMSLERDFEPYEEKVNEVSMALDEWIQMQIDIMRGK